MAHAAPPPPPPPPFPAVSLRISPPGAVRIEGKALVAPLNYTFPEICVVTGQTSDLVRMRRTLYWHSPWVYLTIFTGLLIYVILAVVLRKTAHVTFSITRAERTRYYWWAAASWVSFLFTFGWLMIAGMSGINALFWLSPVSLITSLVLFLTKGRLIYASQADDQWVWLRGIRPEIMARIVSAPAGPR